MYVHSIHENGSFLEKSRLLTFHGVVMMVVVVVGGGGGGGGGGGSELLAELLTVPTPSPMFHTS